MKKKEISLLSEKPLQATAWGRFVSWLTNSGRAVLVFVELAVLLAFISRFWLDTKNNDLGEVIREKKIILESSVRFEKEFSRLQNRMNLAANYIDNRPFGLARAIGVVTQNLPPDTALISFNFLAGDKISKANVDLQVLSEESLAVFINKLARDKRVASVEVGKIEGGKLSRGTDINLTINFSDLPQQ